MMCAFVRMVAWLVLVVVVVLSGCGPESGEDRSSQRKSGERIRIVCTVGMVSDVVRQIAGERAEVIGMIGSGVDPHLYKPTRDDVMLLESADMIFYSGLLLEGRLTDTLMRMSRSRPVVAVTERLDEAGLLESEDESGHADPHVWMDVSIWADGASVIAEVLAEYDRDSANDYRARAIAFVDACRELDAYGQRIMDTVPKERRVLITSHDAFNYFGRAYGLEVMGVQGLSTESEAGLSDINRLVDVIVSRGIGAVFVESSVPRKNIEALIEGARSRGQSVMIGGELFSDAMGEDGTYEGTYLGMMDHNLTTVATALGGTAPERGWRGKLSGGRHGP